MRVFGSGNFLLVKINIYFLSKPFNFNTSTVKSELQSGTLFIFWNFWARLYSSFCHFLLNKSPNLRDCIRDRTLIESRLYTELTVYKLYFVNKMVHKGDRGSKCPWFNGLWMTTICVLNCDKIFQSICFRLYSSVLKCIQVFFFLCYIMFVQNATSIHIY